LKEDLKTMAFFDGGVPHHPDFSSEMDYSWMDHCPCLLDANNAGYNNGTEFFSNTFDRILQKEEKKVPPVWHAYVVSITLVIMFGFMMSDYIGPDWVMTAGVVLFMACEIVTVKEGVAGFSSAGILTVMALFVVAEGVSRTGALDHYMGMILGRPKTLASAQIRITVPIAILSAFLNNTPIVAVMLPLTIRWSKNIGVPKEQLLIPLSYATILGGTCTLVGTSTNLVVQEALKKYPAVKIGLFDVGLYGVPNAMIGIAYMLLTSQFLLPKGKNVNEGIEQEEVLLGARVTPFSPASGRTVKRSGLTDTAGVYLVYVRRATTGNIHHTVSEDFVLSVG
jgi:di/tricarboxylate transporter